MSFGRISAANAVAATADTAAVMMLRQSLRTRNTSSMTAGVSLMAAAMPINQPWGMRRLRGSRSSRISVMISTFTCVYTAFFHKGSVSIASGQIAVARVKPRAFGASISVPRRVRATRKRHRSISNDEK